MTIRRRPFLNPCLVGLLALAVFVGAPAAQAVASPAPTAGGP
jgi:hypothetical protein